MPAERNHRKPRAGPSAPRPGPTGATEVHKPLALEHRTPDGIPGLSKLKASIRQTKRFLAKEGLEPGLKIQTQRRLESLEADLAKAEKRNVEMKNGTKYHAIKFFERQKLVRIIRKQQRLVDKVESSSTKVQAAEQKLEHARVMLNYVLNFPNTEKYISLFPSNAADDTEPEKKAKLPTYLDEPSKSSTDLDKPSKRRLELLLEMRRLMTAGKLSATPEEGLGSGEVKAKIDLDLGGGVAASGPKKAKAGRVGVDEEGSKPSKAVGDAKEEEKTKKEKKKKDKASSGKADTVELPSKAGDDFFED